VDWKRKRPVGTTSLKLNQGATLDGKVSSPNAFQFDLPREGRLEARWNEVDLGLFHSLLPGDLTIMGKNSGAFTGAWLAG
jgi:hypothetical protein